MRIALIGDGASVHNHFMIEWLMNQGYQVCFLTDTPDDRILCQTEVIVPTTGGVWRHALAAWRVRRFLQAWKPDIVHAHNLTGYGYWGALAGVQPLMVTAWGSDVLLLPQQNPLVRWMVRFVLRQARCVTADARSLGDAISALEPTTKPPRLLQWGIDVAEFAEPGDSGYRAEIRGSAGFVFLSTRRLRSLYNIDTIIHAFSLVYARHPEARLVIVGDDEQAGELRQLCQTLRLEDAVRFTGWVTRPQLIDVLKASDVWISVPSSDSTPLSLLEAFAASLPVIVSDLPAMHEWVSHGINGYLVPPRSREDLARAMLQSIQNPQSGKSWGEANRDTVLNRANRDQEMERLVSWYRELSPTVPS